MAGCSEAHTGAHASRLHQAAALPRPAVQVSTALSALLCDMLQNPYTDAGWEADADALQEVQELAQEALDMPTAGRPVVVTFCTDGSRAALVRPPALHAMSASNPATSAAAEPALAPQSCTERALLAGLWPVVQCWVFGPRRTQQYSMFGTNLWMSALNILHGDPTLPWVMGAAWALRGRWLHCSGRGGPACRWL